MEETQLSPAVSTNPTPYTTAPSSPHRFPNFFYSAPTSPIHALVGFQQHHHNNDFAFDFTQPPSLSAADELFHAGQIKPLKPPVSDHPPKSPTFSPKCKKKNFDPFTQALNQTPGDQAQNPPKRGRETTINTARTRDKVSRSSSPFRISDILSDEDNNQKNSLTWYPRDNYDKS
ncbi:hypothetical protein L1987_78563 [Smallanthus sonchifolius]|uniref:Uncharacterized protein n=1 Tax=Smallanthus sonchifolius TaxID=185202 RepID=A0ACB8ZDK6_9ASTR|nr:hypothetical protein L1987_78563 [Smallanthus sonchifolius]